MARMNLPSAPAYRRTSYSGLLGADFSVDPSLVDKKRSPDLLNMISDNGGNPIKRKGWEIVNNSHSGEIENIWSFYANDKRYIVFTCKTGDNTAELICMDEEGEEQTIARNGVSIGKHCAFFTNTSDTQFGFYILDGSKYHRLYHNGTAITHEEVTPYVPTILISRSPTGGGTVYDDVNLLTKARKEQFLNTASNKTFVVSSQVNTSKPYSVKYKSGENWVVDSSATVSGATFTVSTAHAPVVAGQDNILIEYYATGDDKSGQILNCTTSAHFSATVQDQIFLTGNPNNPNSVFYSAFNNLAYFPDLNYLNIGGENKIMGFLNLGEYLAVIKEGTSDDSTIFLIYQTSIQSTTVSSSDGKTTTTQERTFAVKRATAGIGAISKYAFGVLNDEPLFLSSFGVCGVISTNTTSEKIVRNRSFFLDPKLTAEDDLKDAVGTVWNNYYVLFTNGREYKTEKFINPDNNIEYEKEVSDGHVYILDGRHKTSNNAGNTSYGYEAYYWEGVPAISVCSYDMELWFGTSRGEVCRFKNSGQSKDYSDATVKSNPNITGVPIKAVWSTPNDNDGASEYFKTMQKKGTMCTVAPYQRSSVKVYLRPDGYPRQYIGMTYVDISGLFDGEIDFGRLSFDPRTTPRDSFFKKKQKKYIRLQIILENDALDEPFGVFEIVKTYVVTRFAKNRAFVQGKGTPTESPIFQRHTITVEDDEGNTKSIDINGTRWQ